jgi:hypothetical protein
MKWKSSVLLAVAVCAGFIMGTLAGCAQPDNPEPKAAPPPPPPTDKELKVPKVGSGKAAYGASDRYQKAFNRKNKADE